MADKITRQVPSALQELEDEDSKLFAKKTESNLTNKEEKRLVELGNFFDWLLKIGFYHKLNSLSPYLDKKILDGMLLELKAREPNSKIDKKEEIRILTCKECGCQVDEWGCNARRR